jgi:hypothetical protein
MTPIAIKVAHSQPVAALARKAGERIDKLMKSQSDAIFTYAWEPSGTRCAVQAICDGTFIVQCNVSILEKEVLGQGMIMDSTAANPKREAETLAKVEKMFSELVAAKKKK